MHYLDKNILRLHTRLLQKGLITHLSFLIFRSPRSYYTWSNFTEKLLDNHFFPNWSLVSARRAHCFCTSPGTPPPACFSLLREASGPSRKSLLSLLLQAREKLSLRTSKGEARNINKTMGTFYMQSPRERFAWKSTEVVHSCS